MATSLVTGTNANPTKWFFIGFAMMSSLGQPNVVINRNIYERLLVILEFTHIVRNRTSCNRFKNKELTNIFNVGIAVNIAGLVLRV